MPITASLLILGALAAPLQVSVRDSVTGTGIRASLETGARSFDTDEEGRRPLDLAAGEHGVVVRARGYRPLAARLAAGPGAAADVTVWLDREENVAEMRERSAPGTLVVQGFVNDAARLRPLPGAVVRLELAGLETVTDERGAFRLEVPAGEAERPAEDDLVVEKRGFVTHAARRTLLAPGDLRLLVDLRPGSGFAEEDARHKVLLAEREGFPVSPFSPSEEAEEPPTAARIAAPSVLQPVDPPASIRVGTSCTCSTCSGVSVMSLETYVKRGLNDEWISSWSGQSLRAGAIAYRSYGSYYVLHPISGSYDICSTTCCQVYSTSTTAATDAAAAATAGILLERSGAVFRSEYSAENNALLGTLSCTNSDRSCGDGFAGSPAASWPCLSDSVCAGQSCFGHGRGMCQWGTQRWASSQARWWAWITNHYYNDGGTGTNFRTARMTSPIRLTGVSPSPAALAAGETFSISIGAANDAETSHAAVWAGASLYSPATGWLSDAPHDANVPLAPGANGVSRLFTVPPGTPDGAYDLVVALWLDVNGSGTIGADDLALVSMTLSGAISVGAVCVLPDVVAPVVAAPAAVAAEQALCCGTGGGATPATSAPLAAFVNGGSAADLCTPSPTRLAPRAGGADVTSTTCFPAGSTAVTFRFQDGAGNVGTDTSTVTVRMFGDLNVDGVVDPSDWVILRDYLNLVMTPGVPPFAAALGMADLTHDAAVDPGDFVVLRDYLNFVTPCLAP